MHVAPSWGWDCGRTEYVGLPCELPAGTRSLGTGCLWLWHSVSGMGHLSRNRGMGT